MSEHKQTLDGYLRTKYSQKGYHRHGGVAVETIEAFEAIACGRRLLVLTISFTRRSQRMGLNSHASEAIRASREANRKVNRLFIEHTR